MIGVLFNLYDYGTKLQVEYQLISFELHQHFAHSFTQPACLILLHCKNL